MEDIYNTSKLLAFILFADDTTVFLSDKNINVLISIMNCKKYVIISNVINYL